MAKKAYKSRRAGVKTKQPAADRSPVVPAEPKTASDVMMIGCSEEHKELLEELQGCAAWLVETHDTPLVFGADRTIDLTNFCGKNFNIPRKPDRSKLVETANAPIFGVTQKHCSSGDGQMNEVEAAWAKLGQLTLQVCSGLTSDTKFVRNRRAERAEQQERIDQASFLLLEYMEKCVEDRVCIEMEGLDDYLPKHMSNTQQLVNNCFGNVLLTLFPQMLEIRNGLLPTCGQIKVTLEFFESYVETLRKAVAFRDQSECLLKFLSPEILETFQRYPPKSLETYLDPYFEGEFPADLARLESVFFDLSHVLPCSYHRLFGQFLGMERGGHHCPPGVHHALAPIHIQAIKAFWAERERKEKQREEQVEQQQAKAAASPVVVTPKKEVKEEEVEVEPPTESESEIEPKPGMRTDPMESIRESRMSAAGIRTHGNAAKKPMKPTKQEEQKQVAPQTTNGKSTTTTTSSESSERTSSSRSSSTASTRSRSSGRDSPSENGSPIRHQMPKDRRDSGYVPYGYRRKASPMPRMSPIPPTMTNSPRKMKIRDMSGATEGTGTEGMRTAEARAKEPCTTDARTKEVPRAGQAAEKVVKNAVGTEEMRTGIVWTKKRSTKRVKTRDVGTNTVLSMANEVGRKDRRSAIEMEVDDYMGGGNCPFSAFPGFPSTSKDEIIACMRRATYTRAPPVPIQKNLHIGNTMDPMDITVDDIPTAPVSVRRPLCNFYLPYKYPMSSQEPAADTGRLGVTSVTLVRSGVESFQHMDQCAKCNEFHE